MTPNANAAIVAIWNPASGSAPEEDELAAALGPNVDLIETTEDDPGTGQTQKAVDAGANIVVACGGDGTVRACLAPLANSNTALGIVPLGTGNLLASNLGIPAGLEAGSSVGSGARRVIDLGSVNGESFAVMAGSGFDALMIRDASDTIKSKLGTVAYVMSGAKNLKSDLVGTTITIDGDRWFAGRSTMVLVGNFGEISGGIEVFPDAQPDDGLLDIAVMSATTFRDWASIGWRLLRRKPQKLELARRARGARIVVTHSRPRIYELDGEDRPAARELVFSVEPSALTIHHEGTAS